MKHRSYKQKVKDVKINKNSNIDIVSRKNQMARMCAWLVTDFDDVQGALAKALNISQSMLSSYSSDDLEGYSDPRDIVKERFVNYLVHKAPKDKACEKWTIAEFTRYMDSKLDPQAFTKSLRVKPVDVRQPVQEVYSSLSEPEKIEFVEYFFQDIKEHLHAA